jgi:molybdate transport system regulatory protein
MRKIAGQGRGTGLTHLRVSLSSTAYVGPGRADLMQGIAETGSIAAAGKRMGMSYKRAWELVQALNTGFGRPLVETSRGGSAQGGARLTDAGAEVLARYRQMQVKAKAAIADDLAALAPLIEPDADRRE